MKDEYDFAKGKRGPILPKSGKTRITIYLDDVVLDAFRALAEELGTGYQTLINEALRKTIAQEEGTPVSEEAFRRILQEELQHLVFTE